MNNNPISFFCLLLILTFTLLSSVNNVMMTIVDAQFTTTTRPTPTPNPLCLCNFTCQGTNNLLDENFAFTINYSSSLFNRYNFRRAVGLRLAYNQFAVIDKQSDLFSFTFGFRPADAMKLTSNRVCRDLDSVFLASQHACCLRNFTNPATDSPMQSSQASEGTPHQTQLIVCWITIVAATGYLIYMTKKNSAPRDSALELALDLATQQDDDEG